jgi:hypothetical protein
VGDNVTKIGFRPSNFFVINLNGANRALISVRTAQSSEESTASSPRSPNRLYRALNLVRGSRRTRARSIMWYTECQRVSLSAFSRRF